MKLYASLFLSLAFIPLLSVAAPPAITRRDGFLLMWQSLRRPAEPAKSVFTDLPDRPDNGSLEIDFAASRGLISDESETFNPDDPLTLDVALTWLLRTRSVAPLDEILPINLPIWMKKYPIASLEGNEKKNLTEDELLDLMRTLDQMLVEEIHESSLYSEKFHGKGTAFGEIFDMYAMTAAHRTYPYNTLVKVTNVDNDKSVTVRINDRGPFIEGRDMDLSLGAFTAIALREKGKINVRFERLGDATLVGRCRKDRPRQQRITKDTILTRGVPHTQPVRETLTIESTKAFVVRGLQYPDGNTTMFQDWVLPGESFSFIPSVIGRYGLILGSVDGHRRTMEMEVVSCS